MNKRYLKAAETRKLAPLMIESYENGNSMRVIAELFNVSHGTVRNILIENGVKFRKRGNKPH